MDGKDHKIVYGDYGIISEQVRHLKIFYSHLQNKGLNPFSATIDGSLQQSKYLKESWESLIIQRCLVHISKTRIKLVKAKTKEKRCCRT